jgi:hypothetical protein
VFGTDFERFHTFLQALQEMDIIIRREQRLRPIADSYAQALEPFFIRLTGLLSQGDLRDLHVEHSRERRAICVPKSNHTQSSSPHDLVNVRIVKHRNQPLSCKCHAWYLDRVDQEDLAL